MTYHVHSIEQDLAHKWYARVCISDTEAIFLKFQDFPTMEAIQAATTLYVSSLHPRERPTAEYIDQEWLSPEGVLWRVTQARDIDGQFMPDDPATPERESLEWMEVTSVPAE